jgi:hypothetical protein
MKSLQRFSIGAGSVAAAALALTLFVPKTAHAVAAAFVQVVNTAASPAIAQDVSKLASENVLLWNSGNTINPHSAQFLSQVLANGSTAPSAFVVPAGESLVITSVDITPSGSGSSPIFIGIGLEEVVIPDTPYTNQLRFQNGIVVPAGSGVNISDYGISADGLWYVYVHGYLTSN